MSMVVVPNALAKQINAALDAAFVDAPEAKCDRAYFYNELLLFYEENGYVPEFTLAKKSSEVMGLGGRSLNAGRRASNAFPSQQAFAESGFGSLLG